MRSPFQSEARAFRFVLFVAVAATAVAVTDVVAPPAVLIVVSTLTVVGVAAVYLREGRAGRVPAAPAHVGPPAERRALLLVDEPPRKASLAFLREQVDRVHVVSLPSVSAVRHWLSDVDLAQAQAQMRMDETVSRLRALQIHVTGVVGSDDAFTAVDDALRTFGGDESFVATADADLISRLQERYAIPVEPAGQAEEAPRLPA